LNRLSLIQSSGDKRINEAAATPQKEGANLSEYSNNKRIALRNHQSTFGWAIFVSKLAIMANG